MNIKKYFLLIYILLGSMNLYSQEIIKQSGSGYCDCWERDEGDHLRMEKFDLYWDESDLPNGSFDDGTYKWLWNTLIKEYYCGCNFSSTAKSILLKDNYWRNGKKHGLWKEYFKDNTFKTIKYENDLLIDISRFDENGDLCEGKYEGVKFNYAHQKDMVMCIEFYENGVLQHGVYYKDEGYRSNPENDELEVDSIYTKIKIVDYPKISHLSEREETFEQWRERIGRLNPSFLEDDPHYNLKGAYEGGLEPVLQYNGTYNLQSRRPDTGEILKGEGHHTWDLMVKGEEEAGYELYKNDGKWFSRKK